MKKTNLETWIREIEGIEDFTRESLEVLQLRRLNELLERLKARGGIYQNLPDRLESLSQLQTLPFTTPRMLSERPGQFLVRSQSEVSRVISGTTSGTTGQAKRVFYTAGDTEKTVGFFAAGISEMLHRGEKCFIAFPFSGPFGLGDLIAQAVERLGAIPVKAGFGQSYGEACQLLRETWPETYIGFSVPLLSMARMYGKDFPIQRALLSGDACPEGVLKELEALLGSKTYPHYGSRETVLGGAVTCPAFEGMHLRENHIIPEIIDENGQVLPDGEYGELVITTIGMEAMPLLRYRTGDYTRIYREPCPCGGVTRRLARVTRREKGPYSMEALDSVLFSVPELVDYRAEYRDGLKLTLRAFRPELKEEITAKVRSIYPDADLSLTICPPNPKDGPMYPGKRYVMEFPKGDG